MQIIATCHRRLLSLILALSVLPFFSCEKDNAIDVNSAEFQEAIYQSVAGRSVIAAFKVSKNKYVISFSDDGLYEINRKQIPILEVAGSLWQVNGEKTNVKVDPAVPAKDVFPELTVRQRQIACGETCIWDSFQGDPSSSPCLFSVALCGEYAAFYFSSGERFVIPIIGDRFYRMPDYFVDHVVEKERRFENLLAATEGASFYAFFTDAHWGRNKKHSPAIIRHLVDYTPIEKVFFGGDALTYRYDTQEEAYSVGTTFQEAYSFLNGKLYSVIGNHDDNSADQADSKYLHLTEEQVYSIFQSKMQGVVYGSYYNYYFDEAETKTRYICLDTGRYYIKQFRTYTFQTARFLADALQAVPDGWHIAMVSHIWCNLVDLESGQCKESTYVRPIIGLLEAYNAREAGTFVYDQQEFAYDFSGAAAKVEYCIGGHTHADAVILSQGGIPLITLTSDAMLQVAGTPAEEGTITEQCVGLVLADYANGKLHLIHVGRGKDTVVDL